MRYSILYVSTSLYMTGNYSADVVSLIILRGTTEPHSCQAMYYHWQPATRLTGYMHQLLLVQGYTTLNSGPRFSLTHTRPLLHGWPRLYHIPYLLPTRKDLQQYRLMGTSYIALRILRL